MTSPRGWAARADRLPTSLLLAVSVGVLVLLAGCGVLVRATLAPDGPTADVVAITDTFDRAPPPPGLGRAPGGELWESTGGWEVRERRARVLSMANDPFPTVAVVDTGASDGVVSARGWRIRDGWGFVFRYLDDRNYWAVVAAPSFANYALVRTVDGVQSVVGESGLSAAEDPETEVAVRLDGETVTMSVQGIAVATARDEVTVDATRAGLYAASPQALASGWTEFLARGPEAG